MKLQSARGFTLLELVVIATILIILVSIVIINVNEARGNGRDKARIQTLKQYQLALDVYYERTGEFPPGIANPPEEGMVSCSDNALFLEELVTMGLFGAIQEDPLNKEPHYFGYAVSQDQEQYVLTAYLERDVQAMQKDGGFCDNYYEVGPWKGSSDPYNIFDVCTYPNPQSVPCN